MPVQLGARPLADFDQPIDLLMDCHRRVEHFLGVLLQVAKNAQNGKLATRDTASLTTALDYFVQAAPRHTEDEERSLFPRLRESKDPRAAEALSKIERLEADHKLADSAHKRIEELGRLWLAQETLPEAQYEEFILVARHLIAFYHSHIRCEDEEVFPVARAILSDESLHRIGSEMKHRRLADPGRPESNCAKRRAGLSM